MKRPSWWRLAIVIVSALLALYVALEVPRPDWVKRLLFWQPESTREIGLRLGLDLQGGLQVLLAADVPEGEDLDALSMETARRIVESRVNSLGLTEPVVQAQGERRIIVELPGIRDPEQAVETIKGTALLEFAHAGYTPLAPGTIITTSLGGPKEAASEPDLASTEQEVTPAPTIESISPGEPSASDGAATGAGDSTVYETILTGAGIKQVGLDLQQGEYLVPFELNEDASEVFAQYTSEHIGQFLCIVLDKEVISCPRVEDAISDGQAMISGKFTYDTARQLSIQLRYGALPVPLRVESFSRIGATHGEESVQQSVRAGIIGLAVVLVFMIVYYRVPGALAALALVIYVLINIALYKLVPITLTLPGIAGFLLSSGMAVDANILIFERMKEELRRGRSLASAIEIGFNRAWPSIRDGQLSTLIITAVLFIFGNTFGASMVKGFAMTLAIGTIVNLFTAVFATRSFLSHLAAAAGGWLAARPWSLGV